LKAIRDGRHEKHHPKSDGVRRDGVDLGVRSGVAETLYDRESVRTDSLEGSWGRERETKEERGEKEGKGGKGRENAP
jgi:hypothetical protein